MDNRLRILYNIVEPLQYNYAICRRDPTEPWTLYSGNRKIGQFWAVQILDVDRIKVKGIGGLVEYIIDGNGKFIIPPNNNYQVIQEAGPYYLVESIEKLYPNGEDSPSIVTITDKNGKELSKYYDVRTFHINNTIVLYLGNQYQLLDYNLNIVSKNCKPIFAIDDTRIHEYVVLFKERQQHLYKLVTGVKNGKIKYFLDEQYINIEVTINQLFLRCITPDHKVRFIRCDNLKISPTLYDGIDELLIKDTNNDYKHMILLKVLKDDKFGLLDIDFNTILQPKYKNIRPDYDESGIVLVDDNTGCKRLLKNHKLVDALNIYRNIKEIAGLDDYVIATKKSDGNTYIV